MCIATTRLGSNVFWKQYDRGVGRPMAVPRQVRVTETNFDSCCAYSLLIEVLNQYVTLQVAKPVACRSVQHGNTMWDVTLRMCRGQSLAMYLLCGLACRPHSHDADGDSPILAQPLSDQIWVNRAFCGKSTTFGTHVHDTKKCKFSYSAKPDFPCGAVAAIFKNGHYVTIS